MLNLLSTPDEDLRRAFDAMEGEGFFDLSVSKDDCSVASARCTLERCFAMQSEHPDWFEDDETIPETIYGQGGWNRYIVRIDGSILLSEMHVSDWSKEAVIRQAQELGFGIFQ